MVTTTGKGNNPNCTIIRSLRNQLYGKYLSYPWYLKQKNVIIRMVTGILGGVTGLLKAINNSLTQNFQTSFGVGKKLKPHLIREGNDPKRFGLVSDRLRRCNVWLITILAVALVETRYILPGGQRVGRLYPTYHHLPEPEKSMYLWSSAMVASSKLRWHSVGKSNMRDVSPVWTRRFPGSYLDLLECNSLVRVIPVMLVSCWYILDLPPTH